MKRVFWSVLQITHSRGLIISWNVNAESSATSKLQRTNNSNKLKHLLLIQSSHRLPTRRVKWLLPRPTILDSFQSFISQCLIASFDRRKLYLLLLPLKRPVSAIFSDFLAALSHSFSSNQLSTQP